MELKELKKLSTKDLGDHVLALKREQFNLRMQKGSGQLTKTHDSRRVRREIARTKTLISAKQDKS